MPTKSPLTAPSETLSAAVSPSVGVVGATLVTAMVKFCEVEFVPSLACTVIVWLVAFSKFNRLALATRTTPVELLIAKRPPALLVRLNVTVPP